MPQYLQPEEICLVNGQVGEQATLHPPPAYHLVHMPCINHIPSLTPLVLSAIIYEKISQTGAGSNKGSEDDKGSLKEIPCGKFEETQYVQPGEEKAVGYDGILQISEGLSHGRGQIFVLCQGDTGQKSPIQQHTFIKLREEPDLKSLC